MGRHSSAALFVAVATCIPALATAQPQPFQNWQSPTPPLSDDGQQQLARVQAGTAVLAQHDFQPAGPSSARYTSRQAPFSATTGVGPGRHLFVAYPSQRCVGLSMQVTAVGSNQPYPTQDFQGAPIVDMTTPTGSDLRIKVTTSSPGICGFQLQAYDSGG
jgi:hypothetical protein